MTDHHLPSTDRETFARSWDRAVATRPDAPFLVWVDDDDRATTWTYAHFDDLVASVAGGLAERGVATGDTVHLALANSPAFVAAWLAAIRLGAVMAPSDPRSTTP